MLMMEYCHLECTYISAIIMAMHLALQLVESCGKILGH